MQGVKITYENKDKIEEILVSVNGASIAHCFISFVQIAAEAVSFQTKLSRILGMDNYAGASYSSVSGDTGWVSGAPKNQTRVKIECRRDGYYLTSVERVVDDTGSELFLTKKQRDLAVKLLDSKFTVIR